MKTELHNKIERIILTAINSIPSSRPFEVYGDVFALPEDLDIDQLAVNPSSLRLAVNTNIAPEEGYTASGYGVLIRSNKPYATFTFRERGLATSVCVPWPTEPGTAEYIRVSMLGSYVGSCKNYTTVEEMSDHISQLRRGYTLREPEKTTNCRVSVDRKYWDCAHTGGTGSFGRPVATINTMLKGFGLPQLDTLAGNDMLAKVAAAVNDERAVVSWLEAPISELYSNESSSYQRFTSCMKGESPETFEIYDELQEAGRLRMLLVHKASRPESGTHIGRALVWVGANPDDSYIDRIYCESAANSSDPNPMVTQAISDFCKAEGIGKTVYEQTARVIPFLTHTTLRVKSNFYFDRYPYVDSLRYLYDDGWLSTSSSRGYNCRILNQTDGRFEGQDDEDDLILCACGSYYPEDETRFSNSRGETYHNDDVSWVSTSDDFIPDDDIVRINGTDYDRERDDVVELHDGDYALYKDAVELHNGDCALQDDAVLLHDGDYALLDDAVELPDGYFVLRVDAHENEDGTWSVNP